MKKIELLEVGKLKRKAILTFLILNILVIFVFMQQSEKVHEGLTVVVLEIELNESTKDNLTAVFYFNNNNTYHTDNSTLNQDFLNYFTNQLKILANQVSGILALPLKWLSINHTSIEPVFELSNQSGNFELTNTTATLLLEKWYIHTAKAYIICVYGYIEDELDIFLKTIKKPIVLATFFTSLLILSLYLKKDKSPKADSLKH